MKIAIDWLKEYVDFGASAEEVGHALTMGGLEIEALERVDLPDGSTAQVLELNVTPNRGYCLSYLGVAREVGALLGCKFNSPEPHKELEQAWGSVPVEQRVRVENREDILCPRYAAMVIDNVTVGPSPEWLLNRLAAIGLRPINNVVDITNFVMMEYGQPLHAFDGELLAGSRIVIRRAKNDEPLISLDGTELKLGEDALVIADAEKPVALAGIMGGVDSQVSSSTRTVVLESACFDPVTVRKGSKKYGIRTDSSYRFERGVDIDGVIKAQTRAALLIRELGGGELCKGRIDIYPKPMVSPTILLRVNRVNQILGSALNAERIREYLLKLGLKVEETGPGERFEATVPGHRPTLTREIDLIEEIARLHGFHEIEPSNPHAHVTPVHVAGKRGVTAKFRHVLCHFGYSEAVNYSFIEETHAEEFKPAFGCQEDRLIPLSNPLSRDWSTMRTSLIPGLLKNAAGNLNKGQKPVKLFEFGSCFLYPAGENAALQRSHLAACAMGPYENSIWKPQTDGYDFYDLKGALEMMMSQARFSLGHRPSTRPFLTPEKSLDLLANGRDVGFLGELEPEIGRKWELGQKAYLFEMDLDSLMEAFPESPRFQPIPKFPETYRDISILVDKFVTSEAVTRLIETASAPLLSRVELYDHFEGKKIQPGKKSLTYSLAFQSPERTLTDEEVNPVFDKVVSTLAEKLGATLRE